MSKVAQPYYGFPFADSLEEDNGYLNGAVYGDYGSGKTYFAGTMYHEVTSKPVDEFEDLVPEGVRVMRNVIMANAEQGNKGLPKSAPKIVVQKIKTYKDFGKFFNFLKFHNQLKLEKNVEKLLQLQGQYFGIPAKKNNLLIIFDGVIVDSLTEIQKFCIYQILGMETVKSLEEEPDKMLIADWGTALEMILLMLRKFRDLDMHKLFVLQERVETDDKDRRFILPGLQGQAKTNILGLFDFVGYYKLSVLPDRPALRRMFLAPIGNFKAKNRFEHFTGHYIDNPTFSDIVNLDRP